MSATLKDIAQELNVSINTVSHALRDLPDISPETTALVKATAARLGYRKNIAASYLRTGKTLTLGVIVSDIQNPVFSAIFKGIEKVCATANYMLILGNTNEDANAESRILENMLNHGVDGIFLVPSMKNTEIFSQLEKAQIPHILLQRKPREHRSHYVEISDYEGGYLAAKHLYHLGHRSFLYVSAPMYISSARDRYEGFIAYLGKKNVSAESVQVLECENTRTGSYKAVKKWMEQQQVQALRPTPTAIFCFSDYMAFGVYSALEKCGIRIPEDISVVGCDNNEFSDMIIPPLTTVDLQPYKLGKEAAKLMFQILNDDEGQELHSVVFSPKLIPRSSTQQIPAE